MKTQRDYYFDNAKFILIFFVVFGHLLRTFIEDNEMIFTIYKVIYAFHMPAFILISGFFARGIYERGYVKSIAKKLILPYLIFQFIYSVFYYFLYNKPQLTIDILNPHWSLWFLISLFFWHIMLLIFSKLRPEWGLAIAFAIGLAVGYVDGISNFLSLSRTFVFFPMFLLGYHLSKDQLKWLARPRIRILAILPFILAFAVFYLFPGLQYEWLLGSKPYSMMDAHMSSAILIRTALYIMSAVMVFSFLAIVPTGKFFFTRLGRNTLYVYLLHGFFVRVFRESSMTDYFNSWQDFLLLASLSLIVTLFLSSGYIKAAAQPIIELKTAQFNKYKYKLATLNKNE